MLKIRRSHDRLMFNMGIPIPKKDGLNITTGLSVACDMLHVYIQAIANTDIISTVLLKTLNLYSNYVYFPNKNAFEIWSLFGQTSMC